MARPVDAPADQQLRWTNLGVYAAGRGRLDVVECAGFDKFPKVGDFWLFDAHESVSIDSQRGTFQTNVDSAARYRGWQAKHGMTNEFHNLMSSIVRLGDGELIAGYATTRHRVDVSFGLALDDLRLQEEFPELARPHATSIHEYWCAAVDGLPPRATFPHRSMKPPPGEDDALAATLRAAFDLVTLDGTVLRARRLPLEPGFFDRWRNPPSPSPPNAG